MTAQAWELDADLRRFVFAAAGVLATADINPRIGIAEVPVGSLKNLATALEAIAPGEAARMSALVHPLVANGMEEPC